MLSYSIVTLVDNLNTKYHRKLSNHSFIKALLRFLSDNCQNRVQFNAVIVQQKEMERVGVEPTTSASHLD
jgi:hypothetical protein